jgi:predicted TIM-barrel fold metal-dependent hydrolase
MASAAFPTDCLLLWCHGRPLPGELEILTKAVKKLVEYTPTRLLWGSDWPHPQYFKPMPNDVALLDMMLDWVPDEKTRRLIFVENPAEIFGFPAIDSDL